VNLIPVLIALLVIMVTTLIWIFIARRSEIYVHRKERSVRKVITGMGVIFTVATILSYWQKDFSDYTVLIAVSLLAVVSLLDDIMDLSIGLRLFIQLIVAGVVYMAYPVLDPWWMILLLVVWMNMFNFMDGSNGMLGLYALVVLASVLFSSGLPVQLILSGGSLYHMSFILILALLVFLAGNLRKHAVWIAGDAGSVVLGLLVIWILLTDRSGTALQAVDEANFSWLFIPVSCALFVTDTGWTLIRRIYLRQPVWQRHRLHAYQMLIYHKDKNPVLIAFAYAVLQLLVNMLFLISGGGVWMAIGIFVVLSAAWWMINRNWPEKSDL